MSKKRILLVEDDTTLSFIIQDALIREGFDVTCAPNGEIGLERFLESTPDLVIADVMMPRMDGFEMVRRIRSSSPLLPVLFLTARTALDDVVRGFEIGANDYLRKPFLILELVVRINASQKLSIGKEIIELSHIEALIADELFRHPNSVVEAKTLMYRIWQNDDYNNLNRLHGFIYKIRKYLSKSSVLTLLNVRGIGYKLSVPDISKALRQS